MSPLLLKARIIVYSSRMNFTWGSKMEKGEEKNGRSFQDQPQQINQLLSTHNLQVSIPVPCCHAEANFSENTQAHPVTTESCQDRDSHDTLGSLVRDYVDASPPPQVELWCGPWWLVWSDRLTRHHIVGLSRALHISFGTPTWPPPVQNHLAYSQISESNRRQGIGMSLSLTRAVM